MIDLSRLKPRLGVSGRVPVSGVPQGFDAMLLPEIARQLDTHPLIHVALDDQRLAALAEQLAFFAPELEVLRFPAWDCLPYDRVSRVITPPPPVCRRTAPAPSPRQSANRLPVRGSPQRRFRRESWHRRGRAVPPERGTMH